MNITPNEIKKIVSEIADRYSGAVITSEGVPHITKDGSHKITVQKFYHRFTLFGFSESQFNLIFTLVKSTKSVNPSSWDCTWTFTKKSQIIIPGSGNEYTGILNIVEELVGILDTIDQVEDEDAAFSSYDHPIKHSPGQQKLKDKKNNIEEIERKPMFS